MGYSIRSIELLTGVPIYENINLVQRRQYRFPKSKKRRIQKKWRKNNRYWRSEPDMAVYKMRDWMGRDAIIGHPAAIKRLGELIEHEGVR